MPTVSQRGSRVTVIVEGGPALARALSALDAKIRNVAAKEALAEGGRIIADAWGDIVPIGAPPEDEHPGAYQRAMLDRGAVTVRATSSGASGAVRPVVLSDLPDDQQPRLYAARLEFGDADREAQPSARPAFDAAYRYTVNTITDILRRYF